MNMEREIVKKIYWFEPLFFLFFGIFHLHRIWGILDRKAYDEFWLGIMESRGVTDKRFKNAYAKIKNAIDGNKGIK